MSFTDYYTHEVIQRRPKSRNPGGKLSTRKLIACVDPTPNYDNTSDETQRKHIFFNRQVKIY